MNSARRYCVTLCAALSVTLVAALIPADARSIGRLLSFGAKLGRTVPGGSSVPYHLRAERMVRSRDFRLGVLTQLKAPDVASRLERSFELAGAPRYHFVVQREVQIMRASENALGVAAREKDEIITAAQGLMHELLGEVPLQAYRSRATLEAALREALAKRAAIEANSATPKFAFELANGKLTFPDIGTMAGVQVKGGQINAYAIVTGLAALISCGSFDCIEKASERLLDKYKARVGEKADSAAQDSRSSQQPADDLTPTEAQEKLRRAIVNTKPEDDPLLRLVADLQKQLEPP